MPIINVKLIENVFSNEQKKEIISRLTDTMVDIEGENMRSVTWVYIEDIKEGDLGIGGHALRAADVHSMQRGE